MTDEQRARQLAGLVKRNREDSPLRKHRFDEHYFDIIDAPEKAYWLGFIAGDGMVAKGGLTIGLAARDIGHLESFAAALRLTAPVRRGVATVKGKDYPNATLIATSWRMVEALAAHGIHPRKSLTLEPWEGQADLMPHYWRGLVDADGSIATGRDWSIGLVGTKAVVSAFGEWANAITPLTAKARPNKGIWRFVVGGRLGAQAVARVLYEGAPVALARKADKAALLIASGPNRCGTPEVRARISATLKGRPPSQANRDAHGTPEARERARQRALGRKASEETKQKMRESHRLRRDARILAEMQAHLAEGVSDAT
jgi:hypothetical protein